MKRVLIFIGLKVAELLGGAVLVCVLAWIGYLYKLEELTTVPGFIANLILGALSVFGLFLLVVAVWMWIDYNWEKAGEMARRRGGK